MKDSSVRRDLAFVSTVISHAIDTLPGAPSHNPCFSFRKRHLKENARVRWLRPAEYEKLIGACTTPMHELIIETAVFTGMRHGELIALRKPMIDFSRREVYLDVEHNKNSKPRVVPLCVGLCEKLERSCAQLPGDLVFAHQNPVTKEWSPFAEFNNFWKAARRRSKLEDLRFHDLRHTFASWWVQSGGSLLELKKILGHSSLTMGQRYAHLDTSAFHGSIQKVFGAQFAHSQK